jgi:hypothetical protein
VDGAACMMVAEVSVVEGRPPKPGMLYSGWDGGGPNGGGRGRRSSMDESLAAMVPNCLCSPRSAAVRVSVWDPDEELEATDVVDGVVMRDEGCGSGFGSGFGGTVVDGAAEVLAMGSDEATDTKLVGLVGLRRWYEWRTGGRGEGPRRGRCSDAVLTTGAQA